MEVLTIYWTIKDQIENATRLLYQNKTSKDKLYSNHEPQIYCVAKGKSNKKYEFGSKISIVVTHKKGIVLNCEVVEKNKYDGDTLDESISKAEESGGKIKEIYGDKAYRKKVLGKIRTKGTILKDQKLYIGGTKESKKQRKKMKRRSLVESRISEMKRIGRCSRNYLKGKIGDKISSIISGVGENLRIIKRFFQKKEKLLAKSSTL